MGWIVTYPPLFQFHIKFSSAKQEVYFQTHYYYIVHDEVYFFLTELPSSKCLLRGNVNGIDKITFIVLFICREAF